MRAFAEDYVVTPVDEKSCDFRWTVAVTPKGVLRWMSFLIAPLLKMQWGRYIDSLQKWMGEHRALRIVEIDRLRGPRIATMRR